MTQVTMKAEGSVLIYVESARTLYTVWTCISETIEPNQVLAWTFHYFLVPAALQRAPRRKWHNLMLSFSFLEDGHALTQSSSVIPVFFKKEALKRSNEVNICNSVSI